MRRRALTMTLADLKHANPSYRDYIDAGIRTGLSANAVLRMMRADGLAMRTADFYTAWRIRERAYLKAGLAARAADKEDGLDDH